MRHLDWLGGDNYQYIILIGMVVDVDPQWPYKLQVLLNNGKLMYVDRVELQLVWFNDDTQNNPEELLNDDRLNNLLKQIEANLNKPR